MKKLLLILLFIPSLSFAADFSAYVEDRQLYITINGDACNYFEGSLNVSPSCKADRLTKNLAGFCRASINILATEMACDEFKPVTVQIDLDKNNVAPEAELLELTYRGETIEVTVDP